MPPRRQPGPDDTVWLFNEVLEQQPDGTWAGWIEPLDPASNRRLFEINKGTPAEIRDHFITEWCRIEKPEWQEFLEAHAMPFVNKEIPPNYWPPTSGRYRKLGFLPEFQAREVTAA